MNKNIVMNLAASTAPWLAKDSKENEGIVISTRFSYNRKITAKVLGKSGIEKESRNVINGLSKCRNWDDATMFRTNEQPSLTAVIKEKFLVMSDVSHQGKGISAVYKDNLHGLCLVTEDKLKVHQWVNGKAQNNDLEIFRRDMVSLENNISGKSLSASSGINGTQPTFCYEVFLHLPATRLFNYCNFFAPVSEELGVKIEPIFPETGFYRVISQGLENKTDLEIEKLHRIVGMLTDTEENARNAIRKKSMNRFFKTIRNALGNLRKSSLCETWNGCANVLSCCWLAYDLGMLENSSTNKIKQAISNTSDIVAETLTGSTSEKMITKHRIKEIFRALK